MKKAKIDNQPDLSMHVVALNRLMTDLNRETRQTFKPNLDVIVSLAAQMRMHTSVIESTAKRLKNEATV